MKRIAKIIVCFILAPLAWIWTLAATYYMAGGGQSAFGSIAPWCYLLVTLLLLVRYRRFALPWILASFAVGLLWFFTMQPSNDRDWRVDVARTPSVTREGEKVTIRNIRNFRYRSADDFDVAYYDKTFDLGKLDSVDLLMCYWDGNTAIAHTMLSFGFGGEDYVCLSVEVRREKGEAWGGVPGIYNQMEVIYVLGDELDLINQRTGYRGEDVYLYHLAIPDDEIREYFETVLRHVNELDAEPRFYNTFDYNCSSALTNMSKELWPDRPRAGGLSSILNGRTDELLYENGRVSTAEPFEELKRKAYITPVGKKHQDAPDFSRKVREPRA